MLTNSDWKDITNEKPLTAGNYLVFAKDEYLYEKASKYGLIDDDDSEFSYAIGEYDIARDRWFVTGLSGNAEVIFWMDLPERPQIDDTRT